MTPALGLAPAEKDTITVTGEASRGVVPDTVDISVGVQTTAPTPGQALRDNALRMQHITQVLTTFGLQQADVQTMGLNLYPLYPGGSMMPGYQPIGGFSPFGTAPDVAHPPAGYRVDNSLKLTLRDPNRLGELLDGVISAGANVASNVAFRLRDDSQIRNAVLEAAVREARSKADIMAAAMGRHIGQASLAIEEPASIWPQGLGAAIGSIAGRPEPAMPVAGGELLYRARVKMAFALR